MKLHEWSRHLAISHDYLFQDKFVQLAKNSTALDYLKRDFLFRSGTWRGTAIPRLSSSPSRKILLVGHSDYPTTASDLFRLRLGGESARIFAQNLTVHGPLQSALNVSYLPLGLTSPTEESDLHKIFGDFTSISSVVLETTPALDVQSLTPFACFDARTSKKYRSELERICRQDENVVFSEISRSREGRLNYLRLSRSHGLVVCPRGNGHDTHRFYEALYVGALPVVLKSSFSARFAEFYGLPHLSLASWAELRDLGKLRESALEVLSKDCDLSPITFSWWMQKLGF